MEAIPGPSSHTAALWKEEWQKQKDVYIFD